jgi:hypothetical protein
MKKAREGGGGGGGGGVHLHFIDSVLETTHQYDEYWEITRGGLSLIKRNIY